MRDTIGLALTLGWAAALGLMVQTAPASHAFAQGGAAIVPAPRPAVAPAVPGTAPDDSGARPMAAPRRPSLRDSPGWYPVADPESTADRIGRRLNAPAVSRPLSGGLRSLEAIGRAACWAMHHDSPDSLLRLCVSMDEFRDILWREFPQSRPITGLTWEDAWLVLNARLQSGCRGAVQEQAGRYLEFLRWERRDSTAVYKNFKLHNGLILVARDDQGQEQRIDFLRSVVERKGRFKIYSVRD